MAGGTGGRTQSTAGGSSAVNAVSAGGATATVEQGAGTGIPLASGGGSGGTGGAGGALASNSGMSEVTKPCVDTPPPPDPTWPDATCENWATETEECSADWFSQYCDVSCGRCIPEGGAALPQAPDCSGENLPNVTGGEGYTTRYWDCCQTACSQNDGHRCSQDGVQRTGDSNSACQGGGSFACYDESPHAISDCLSYGYIAKANPNCGGCFRIQFTGEGEYNANDPGSKLIKGKQMIVKVSNTGSDVAGNQFDLMIPGGGVGLFNACSRQWNSNDLGAQYGGFLTNCTGSYSAKKECVRQQCSKIPAGAARDGCLWFVDWLQAADDPKFTSQATACPF
jgi:glycosyl hydrolase family 45